LSAGSGLPLCWPGITLGVLPLAGWASSYCGRSGHCACVMPGTVKKQSSN
jgi:hypothetical protein